MRTRGLHPARVTTGQHRRPACTEERERRSSLARGLLAVLLAGPVAVARADPPDAGRTDAVFGGQAREISMKGPGFPAFTSGFAASVDVAGQRRLLTSDSGTSRPVTTSTETTPYGEAVTRTSTLRFENEQLDLMLRVGEVPGVPGLLLQAGIRNSSRQPVALRSVSPVRVMAGRPVSEWPQVAGRVQLDPAYAQSAAQDWGSCRRNVAVSGKPMSIAGRMYDSGLGTHAHSEIVFQLDGACDRFNAFVGADDEAGGTVEFEVWTDGAKAFSSGAMRRGDPAREVDVSVAGTRTLRLVVTDGGNGIGGDHANWANASLTLASQRAGTADSGGGIMVQGEPRDWLVTRLVGNFENKEERGAVCTLAALTNSITVHERGGLYRRDGTGLYFGPVGDPIAYLNASIACAGSNRVALEIVSDMSGVEVSPGETRWGQQAILLFEGFHSASARQTEWVARTHGARTDKGALSGWCSWYLKTSHITGADVLGLVDAVKQSGGRLRPAAIQIDDGYQNIDGEWDANGKFPEGMPFYAKRIAETGARPGLWMALTMIGSDAPWLKDPAHMEAVWGRRFSKAGGARLAETGWIDPTHPLAKKRIADRVRHAVTNGFTYLKCDFNNIGGGNWHERKRTSFEIMRDHYTNVRAAAGEDTYLLFCTTEPIRATVGLVDASRISSDVFRGGIRNGIDQILRSFDLNDRWFAVDADCYYLAPDVKGAGSVQGGWPMIRTYVSMMGLSCGAAFTSDLWQWDDFKPHWRMTEILTPPARERTDVLDLGTSEEWPRLVCKVRRPWGNPVVALLWNPGQDPRSVTLDFARAGLDPSHRYAVWSFWDDKYLGIAKRAWTTPLLPPGGCQQLTLTDLDAQPGRAVLIGSNLHILSGAAEIGGFQDTHAGIEIALHDAGAREGDLFVFSPKPLAAGRSSGCIVRSVEPAGEYVWKVHLEGRETGKLQAFALKLGM